MTVTAWESPRVIESDLEALAFRAELSGLDVVVPALLEGYKQGFDSLGRMSDAVAGKLTDREIELVWRSAAERSATAARSHWMRQARQAGIADRVSSPNLPDEVLLAWRRENEARYRALRDEVRRQTRRHLMLLRGRDVGPETAARDLARGGLPTHNGRLRGRAALIARDQQQTLAGLIARHQQLDAGIVSFIWRTKGDARVRPSHAANNKKTFQWDKLPLQGFPGQEIDCRCIAEGVTGSS